jgi:hypothetical protein
MYVLRRLPVAEAPSTVAVAGQAIPVRAYQIIVWVSLSVEEALGTRPVIQLGACSGRQAGQGYGLALVQR